MPNSTPPNYDFNLPIFKSRRNLMLYAKEHLELWELTQNSDVISFDVKSTISELNIPTTYHVTYKLRSITGIDEAAQPVYGDEHLLELIIPTRYPLEPASIYMLTNAWHPNIQYQERNKGKICGNVKDFGIDYDLRMLVLRVGEILQYRNYLADYVFPFPEDPKVAEWVKSYAEPKGIVNRNEGIFTDYQPLIRSNSANAKTEEGEALPNNSDVQTSVDNRKSIKISPAGSEQTLPVEKPDKNALDKKKSGIHISRRGEEEEPPKRKKLFLGGAKPSVRKEIDE